MKYKICLLLFGMSLFFIKCETHKKTGIEQKNIYWGDIHNHCNIGYAQGSLERAYDIAQSHLDFYCFTPHSQWHDKPASSNFDRFIKGFETTRQNWDKIKRYANESYRPGEFVSFIGFEWHSSVYGDVCAIMPGHAGELVYLDNILDLQQFALENNAVLIPHHPAYQQGWRGQNWSVLGPIDVSPVVEIFSEHGNAESDRAPFRYIRHSMGGRYTRNTYQYLLEQGHQVGLVASTDDHLGYPGAYGEGLVAVQADTLNRAPERLITALERGTDSEWLTRAREADDLHALKSLTDQPDLRDRLAHPSDTRLLWDVCRIPDFRGISQAEHAGLLERIFGFLQEGGVPDDWLARQVKRIDRSDGDIDTLSKRLAYIRTWTYVAQRKGWVGDESHWRGATRAVEDRLSDALHGALTKRFVDRRTSVLLRRLKQKEGLVADVNEKGEVMVEGEFVGRLEGFRFRQDSSNGPDEAKTLRSASLAALKPEFHLRADRFYNAPDTELDFTEQGGLMWGEHAVGKLVAGSEPLKPQVEAFVDEEAGSDVAEKVKRRLQHFIDRKIATLFEPLLNLQRDEALTGLARGFAFRLIEGMGIIPRDQVAAEVKDLDQDSRGMLRKHGVRFGQFTIFLPLLLKPAPTRLRLVLWSLAEGLQEFPESPPPGLVTIPTIADMPEGYYTLSGYRSAGQRAIRIDMLERLADLLRAQDSRGGFEATADMLSITGMTLEQFADLMQGLGYKAERGERPKVKAAAAAPEAAEEAPAAEETAEAAAPEAPEAAAEAPAPEEAPAAEQAAAEVAEPAEPEIELFYTFTWAPRRAGKPRQDRGERPQGKGRGKPKGKGKRPPQEGGGKPRSFQARPPKKEKPIDPDNPFAAALMGLKDRK